MSRRRSFDRRSRYRIWVDCADCGDIAVQGERATLLRCTVSQEVTLAYRCTSCLARSIASVPRHWLEYLIARGFAIRDWRPPRELLEPRPIAPPLTLDDLLDAHELLATTPFVVGLLVDEPDRLT
jgi:hypothetical protein